MTQALWYFRDADQVSGPHPAALIAQYVELGRLGPDSRISQDGHAWTSVQECGQFEVALRNLSRTRQGEPRGDAGAPDWETERALARQRWLDERLDSEALSADSAEHRAGESVTVASLRHDHAQTGQLARQAWQRRPAYRIAPLAAGVLVGVALAVWYGQQRQPEPAAPRLMTDKDCAAPARPEVGWQGCDKRRADLARADLKGARLGKILLDGANLRQAVLDYADLRGASLRGADLSQVSLRGADLTQADLTGADLSRATLDYATLTGATLAGARFSGTRLGKAAWPDGRLCAPGSVDVCG
jgi:hypothetical protein